jgi:multiple sugar transport system permease protein
MTRVGRLFTRKRRLNLLTYAVLIVLILLVNLPFLSMLGTSLKSRAESLSSLRLFPNRIDFGNFRYVIFRTSYARNILNSLIVAGTSTITCVVLASLGGYALSRFRSKLFSAYSFFLLVVQMFPLILLLIPLFIVFNTTKLIDTLLSVILSYTAVNLPFSIWMLKGFFDTIPFELEESALIDGCSRFDSFRLVLLPVSMPGLSTVAIFTFINGWNDYLLASIFLRSDQVKTLTIGLRVFTEQFTTDWSYLMAASTIASIPTLIFLVFAQKYLIRGLTAGSLKG